MKEFKHIPDSKYSQQIIPKIVNSNGMRQYSSGDDLFPSITSILSREMSSEGLDAWKERVGSKVAKYICDSAISRGNKFHKICESYLNNDCTCKFVNHLLAYGMFEQAQPALERISDIVGIEMPMVSRELGIGGTADIIANFEFIVDAIFLKPRGILVTIS